MVFCSFCHSFRQAWLVLALHSHAPSPAGRADGFWGREPAREGTLHHQNKTLTQRCQRSHVQCSEVHIQMGFAQTASVERNLTIEYVRRVDASPREDFCERSSRHLVDDKVVFIAIFFKPRRAGKVTTPLPSRCFSWPGVEEKQLWSPVWAFFCQRRSRHVVDDKGVFIAIFFRGGPSLRIFS